MPRIRFQVQPTVSHYREPLIRCLVKSTQLSLKLIGRFSNAESTSSERIHSASSDILDQVEPVSVSSAGLWWWEKGQVPAVWRGGYDAFVLEGRFYTVSTWVAAAAGRLRGRKVILWGHGWKRPEEGLKRALRLQLYRMVNGLLVYGDRAKELGISYGVPARKIQVVYNSLYSEDQLPDITKNQPTTAIRHSRSTAVEKSPVLLYSARLTPRHRLDLLAEALNIWQQDSDAGPVPEVVVVGDGSERVRLEKLFKDYGLSAQFLGAVYDFDRLKELYEQADAAVSIGGAGLNVIQALSFGVPVIAEADHPDSSPEIEAVIEGETGFYYPHQDADGLRRALQVALAAPEKLRQTGQRGQDLVRERYTAQRHAEAIERGILNLLQR